jgi:hypothetical protein
MSLAQAIRKNLPTGPPSGALDSQDLAAINAFCNPPLAPEQLYAFTGVMCTAEYRKDQPWRFGESSLKNFAADAEVGVPYLLQHDRYTPWNGGMTFAGHYDAETKEARAAIYLLRDFEIAAGVNTDQEIRAIEAGLRRHLSVGPAGGNAQWVCDLCGEDVFGQICPHVPGASYDGRLCTATVEGAHLIELSGVDNGAVPGSMILKARSAVAAGHLSASAFGEWADNYSIPKHPTSLTISTLSTPATVPGAKTDPPAVKTLTPAAPNTGKEIDMREKLAAALSRRGFMTLAAAILGAKEDDADSLAEKLTAQTAVEVEAQVNSHPLVAALAAAEIKSPAAVQTLLAEAKMGRESMGNLRSSAKALAIKVFGQEKGAAMAASIDSADAVSLAASVELWKASVPEALTAGARRVSAGGAMPGVTSVNAETDAGAGGAGGVGTKDPVEEARESARKFAAKANGNGHGAPAGGNGGGKGTGA